MQVSTSPSPAVTIMSFPDAIRALISDQRVTKMEWNDSDIYGQLRHGKLMIHLKDGWHDWVINDGDLLGQDWFILD